ncbi:hypothetical protein FITA111629_01470 [Filibacter tadaridae]|uniref:Lipoprotein n=1 Tax=Filibacter tadaridae TaxID=2483811 RepID=A0A3P5XDY8_9BACL|nr:hypothetical protein [Filibacter tadaridae]VDC29547.1 hypothetical protein FILTAD_02141 [Filibacter tadaridae]
MKKCVLLMFFCFGLMLTACSQSEEDKQEYSGIIGEGKAMGYEYTVSKEQNTFSWKVGYKGDISVIEEDSSNEDNLDNFRISVSDSKEALAKLIIWGSYFLIVVITTFIFYKKKRKKLEGSGAIITVFAGIAIYFAFGALFDLSSSLQNTKYYYLVPRLLINQIKVILFRYIPSNDTENRQQHFSIL